MLHCELLQSIYAINIVKVLKVIQITQKLKMAKKKNRGKKSSGAKAGNTAVPENAQTSTQLKVDSENDPSAVPADGTCDQDCVPEAISLCTPSITQQPTLCQKLYEKKVYNGNPFKAVWFY